MEPGQQPRRKNRRQLNINTALAASPAASPIQQKQQQQQQQQQQPPAAPPSRTQAATTTADPGRSTLDVPSSSNRRAGESFLDNPTPVDADMADLSSGRGAAQRDSRDFHDLSLSPRNVTRDSLVANMLLSLDQFAMGDPNDAMNGSGPMYDDEPQLFDPPRPRAASNGASNGPYTGSSSSYGGRPARHQYSYSSDLEGGDDSSRMSSQQSRGRRSNSSSNFQGPYPRLSSVREPGHKTMPAAPRTRHVRGGRESKSSNSTSASIDGSYGGFVPPGGGHRLAQAAANRPASLGHGPPPATLQGVPMSPFQVEFPRGFIADNDYDVAPNPTVPGGPRRAAPTPSMPPPPPPEPTRQSPALERKRSSGGRSLKSSAGRKASLFREAIPAMPAVDFDAAAPAPLVGYEKSKDASRGNSTGNGPAPSKPGFFRRVFGSSKSSPVDSVHPSRVSSPPDRGDSPASSSNMLASGRQSRAGEAPPSRDTSSSHSHHHPVLQKKPSSFFRRRKKSFVDDQPPLPSSQGLPLMPSIKPTNLQLEKGRAVSKPEPSPVSSLRQVMNPYLRDGPSAPESSIPSPLADITNTLPDKSGDYEDRGDRKREFSPDYEPSPNARIRTVQSHSDLERASARRTDTRSRPATENRSTPKNTKNGSFLYLDGASDNEDESTSHSDRRPSESQRTKADRNDDTIRATKRPPYARQRTDSEDDASRSMLALPIEGARATSPASASSGAGHKSPRKSSRSRTSSLKVDGTKLSSPKALEAIKPKSLDEPDFVVGEPTEDDRQKAQRIYDGSEDFIQKAKAASWMGEEGPVRQRTLQAYMELYDFENTSVVYALRQVCGRLVFRAETQQVDRILVAFSKRWCDCNPNHGFKATDVIHMICYSIMLLNTDLHLADIEQKMTRSQFVKNTMTTITQAVSETVPEVLNNNRPSVLPDKNSMLAPDNINSAEKDQKPWRNSFRGPASGDEQANDIAGKEEDCGPLVKAPFTGSFKAWEEQVELVLKGIYVSIRDERLPLYGAEPDNTIAPSQSGLSVMGMLKRSPSVLSKAPSESQLSTRGRVVEAARGTSSRWTSKSRSRPGLGRNGFSSSHTSLEEGNSLWSPAMSSATWSKYSLGRTQTSVSQDSFGSAFHRGDYQQSIGFANALSQAIIRDEDVNGDGAPSIVSEELPTAQLLEDESLELSGPPWIKEGMIIHKHHLDGVDKKARDRNWTEVFAVVQKGQMSLFSFSHGKSARQKSRTRNATKPNTPVGGGNWQDNATNMGTFNLRQTLASALPSPGYSRTRPHVWALSLPTGAVHLFQVGTPEIIKEFVTTANYWSARLSTHPLIGGISNIEYGWSDNVVNNSLVAAINDSAAPTASGKNSRPGSGTGRRSSVASGSFRSASFDLGSGSFTHSGGRGKLPGDRIHIAVWGPPTQSMRPSQAREAEQLQTLAAYVRNVEEELQTHNQLRSPMLLAFTPRGHNASKAMSNWERKSAYLLREIVKFNTYVDCLHQANLRKQEIYSERDLAHRAARGELSDGDMEFSGGEDEGDVTLRP